MNNRFSEILTTTAIVLLLSNGIASAGSGQHAYKKPKHEHRHDLYEYAAVLESRPVYREVRVSEPLRECWEQPVYHTQRQHKSVGGMLAGGLLGGIIGHQVGGGRGNKVATAVGTLIGAKIGHDAINGDVQNRRTIAGYDEHSKTRDRVSYEQLLDGYDVTYEYRGRQYQLMMPYDPGKHIKMRIEFAPVI